MWLEDHWWFWTFVVPDAGVTFAGWRCYICRVAVLKRNNVFLNTKNFFSRQFPVSMLAQLNFMSAVFSSQKKRRIVLRTQDFRMIFGTCYNPSHPLEDETANKKSTLVLFLLPNTYK
jgi:hypothetical protein